MPNRIDDRRMPSQPSSQNTYRVISGDTLSSIAQKRLGDSSRWSQIYDLNKDRISDSNALKVGQILRMPTKAPVEKPKEEVGTMPADSPAIDSKGNWSVKLANEFGTYVNKRALELRESGYEVDCADLAAKLLKDFCAEKAITNPLGVISKEYIYTPKNNGGLPNVNGPNVFMPNVEADNLAKKWTKSVNDANANGTAGKEASGKIDVADLRAGDILFYDWERDGEVNHTVNVVKVDKTSGNVTIAYGSYDNLNPEQSPATWSNLDLTPVRYIELKPGTEDYEKWLGPQNNIWGVRRYNFMPDVPKEGLAPQPKPAEKPVEPPVSKPKAEEPKKPAQPPKAEEPVKAEQPQKAEESKKSEPPKKVEAPVKAEEPQKTEEPKKPEEKKPSQVEIPKRHPGAFWEFLKVLFGR